MAKESKDRILTDRDITMLGLRSVYLQAGFNFERMQNYGYLISQRPYLEKIYKDDPKGLSEAAQDDLEFINTQPVMAAFLMGLVLSLREKKIDNETVKKVKISLFGPLAGIGDAIFWFTLLPVMIGICASLAEQGLVLGPILFFLFYVAVFLLRIPLTHIGYNMGVNAVDKIKENTAKLNRGASILGVTVMGGLIASYVQLNLNAVINVNEIAVDLQTEFFDMIFPNLLPFAFTFLIYFLLRKKVSPVLLILAIIVLAIGFSYLGIV